MCVLADGSEVQVPVAFVYLNTPYFRGSVEDWCIENPIYGVIIGNIEGTRAIFSIWVMVTPGECS